MTKIIPTSDYDPYDFIWVLTAIFGAIFVIGPILVPRGPDQDLIRISIMETAFYMWIVWVTIYSSQIHPIISPTFKNTTLSWLSYSWGNSRGVQPLTLPSTTTPTTAAKPTTTTRRTPTTTRPPLKIYTNPNYRTKVFDKTPEEPYKGYFDFSVCTNQTAELWFQENEKKGSFPTTKIHLSNEISRISVIENDEFIPVANNNTPQMFPTKWCTDIFFWISWDNGVWELGRKSRSAFLTCTSNFFDIKYLHLHAANCWYTFYESHSTYVERDEPISFLRGQEKVGHIYPPATPTPPQTTSFIDTAVPVMQLTTVSFPMEPEPAYVVAKSHYKFYIIREQPIQFGVLLKDEEMYREFFVLLTEANSISEPYILIHIGAYQGRTCLITKNGEVMVRIPCTMEWKSNYYLMFWIWYTDGEVTVKSGYYTPDNYQPFMTWSDPEPFTVVYYGLRTSVGEEMPMYVIDSEFL